MVSNFETRNVNEHEETIVSLEWDFFKQFGSFQN